MTDVTSSGYTSTTQATPSSGAVTFGQAENFWIQAGGNPQAANMAAAVADASSGLNPNITRTNPDGTTSVGLWLLPSNGSPPGSTDPLANARAAVQLSKNGADWTQWCTAWSDNNCGVNGGTYLGSGSNALMSLGQQLSPASYNVIGSTPAGSGQGASGATANSTTTGANTSSTSHTFLMVGIVVVVVLAAYWFVRRRNEGMQSAQQDAGLSQPEAEPVPGGGSAQQGYREVTVPAHTRRLPLHGSADTPTLRRGV